MARTGNSMDAAKGAIAKRNAAKSLHLDSGVGFGLHRRNTGDLFQIDLPYKPES